MSCCGSQMFRLLERYDQCGVEILKPA